MIRFVWNNPILIQEAISASTSRVETLRRLGYNPKGSISRRKLNKAIEEFNLDTSSFTEQPDRWDVLPDIIHECFSIADVLRAVGLKDQGNNHKTAKKAIEKFNLDTSHFKKSFGGSASPYIYEEVFSKNSAVARQTLKSWINRLDLLKQRCYSCGITEWQGKPITLDLDHINGINNDNRIENLRYLCPNCHSQTPTHRGKNRNHGA